MDPIALLAAACVLGAIVLAMMGIYSATASPRSGMERRLGRMLGETLGDDFIAGSPVAAEGLRQKRSGSIPIIGSIIQGKSWTETLAEDLDRADIKLNVSEFVAARIFLAFVLVVIPFIFLSGILGFIAAVGLGFLGYMLPKLWLGRAKNKRISKLDAQLPDALTMMSNSLKAGFGLMQSLELVSRELDHPIATDMRRTMQEIQVGSTTEEALLNFSMRSGSADLDIVVTAMLIQQSTGGNLAEILENVGHTMRERIRIRGEIKTLTTQGVMTGFIIGGLPVFIGGAVTFMNPGYIEPLFTTLMGNAMIAMAVVLETIGILVIKKIMAIEV
jgi:tight adherence protein B